MPLVRPTLTLKNERGVRDGTSHLRTVSSKEFSSRQRVWFNGNQIGDALKYFLGYSDFEYDAEDKPTALLRLTPTPMPGSAWAFATRFTDLNGHRHSGHNTDPVTGVNLASFDRYDAEISYERLPYDVLEDDAPTVLVGGESERYTSVGTWKSVTENITLPSGAMVFRSAEFTPPNNIPVNYSVGIKQPIFEVPITWHRLPASLWNYKKPNHWMDRIVGTDEEYSYLGTINKTAFFNFPAGTLLLDHAEPIQNPAPVDIGQTWLDLLPFPYEIDIVFTFYFNPMGWNYLYYHDMRDNPTANHSGWYYASKRAAGTAVNEPGSVPDDEAQFNEREFRDLWVVGALP